MFRVVEPLPPDLNQEFKGMVLANEALMYSRDYQKALEGFKSIYRLLLDKQPLNIRYHKGYPLHQIGITLFLSGKQDEALKYFVLAYIEDLLSKEEGQEDKADDEPAGKTLRGAYGVSEDSLVRFKQVALEKKKLRQAVRNPEVVYDEVSKGKAPKNVVQLEEENPSIGQESRQPGQFNSVWEKRVFIGGNYSTHLSELNTIKKVCMDRHYDPVLASEFKTPRGKIHHHSLMLLHECSKAIFEVSLEAGQLMEIERLRDYEIKPLIVCQPEAHLSRMLEELEELVSAQDHEIKRYCNDQELVMLVEAYLNQT
jgi:hypothetical protein